jgi:hypothetical protein
MTPSASQLRNAMAALSRDEVEAICPYYLGAHAFQIDIHYHRSLVGASGDNPQTRCNSSTVPRFAGSTGKTKAICEQS